MFELKKLSPEGVPHALERAKHYRLLNEPVAAESICCDILRVDPENQEALITIILAMSDRVAEGYTVGTSQLKEYLSMLKDEYSRAYYRGIVFEKRGKAALLKNVPGADSTAYELLRQAMSQFEEAGKLGTGSHDDVTLRWNGCARIIMSNKLAPRTMAHDMLE